MMASIFSTFHRFFAFFAAVVFVPSCMPHIAIGRRGKAMWEDNDLIAHYDYILWISSSFKSSSISQVGLGSRAGGCLDELTAGVCI